MGHTQQERSAATQERILDAAIESLVEHGYAGTTTVEVVERAGVSRGAQHHHFPSRDDLMIHAIDRLASKLRAELERDVSHLPEGPDRLSTVIDAAWDAFRGPLFYATLELWVAARTDPALKQRLLPAQRDVGGKFQDLWRRAMAEAYERHGPEALDELQELTRVIMHGLALRRVLTGDTPTIVRLLDRWKHLITPYYQCTEDE